MSTKSNKACSCIYVQAVLQIDCVLAAQVAPVVDASSSQSRTDVLVILLSAVLLLTGLQWLALQPKVKPSVSCCPKLHMPHHVVLASGCTALLTLALQVQLEGHDLGFIQPGLPEDAQQELKWCVISSHPNGSPGRHTVHLMCMHFHAVKAKGIE